MASDLRLNLVLDGEDRGVSKMLDTVNKGMKGIGGVMGDIAKTAAGFALGGAITELPGLLMDMAKGAAADEQATARLSQSIRNLGGDFDSISGAVNDAIATGQKLAFTDDEVRDSFQSLAAATGDADEALTRQRAAMDLAHGANIPLAQATKMLGKLNEENVEVFKRLGITIGENATEADALALVQAKFAGQAEAYASSTAGQFEQATIAMGEIQESIGSALLPVLAALGTALAANLPAIQAFVGTLGSGIAEKVVPALTALGTILTGVADEVAMFLGLDPGAYASGWEELGAILGVVFNAIGEAVTVTVDFAKAVNDNKVVMALLVGVLTATATVYAAVTAATIAHSIATTATSVATKAYTAAQWLMNAAMTANPIGILVVALAALVAALIYAYQNSEEFRAAVDAAWEGVKAATIVAWGVIEPILTLLGAAWAFLAQHVPAMASQMSTAVTSTVTALAGILDGLWQGMKTAATTVMDALFVAMGTTWEDIKAATVSTVTKLKDDVVSGLTALVNLAVALFSGGPGAFNARILTIFAGLAVDVMNSLTGGGADSLKNRVGQGLRDVVDWGARQLDQVYERLVGPFQAAWNKISSLLEAIKSAFETARRIVSNFPGVPGGGGGGDSGGGGGAAQSIGGQVGAKSMAAAGAGGGTTIIVNVSGSVVTEGQLVDKIHTGLLQKQRRNGTLGLIGGA